MTAVRTVLTVAVAAALLGASLPVIAEARADRTEAGLESAATRVTDVAADLVATEDPVPAGERGASRTVSVTLPQAGPVTARATYLSIGGGPNVSAPSTIGYRAAGRPPRRLQTAFRFVTGSTPLVLAPGRHVLRLTVVDLPTGVGVRVDLLRWSTATPRTATAGARRTNTQPDAGPHVGSVR